MDQKIDREKFLAEVTQELKELDDLQEMESLIKDNTIEFSFDEKVFRVRKPNRSEKLQIRSIKYKKHTELLRDPGNVTEAELIQALLQRNTPIDVAKMRQEIKTLQQKIEPLAIRLTECQIPNDRKKIVEEINGIRYEQVSVQLEMSEHLASCIEKQLLDYLREYIVFVVLEQKDGDKWVKVFESYDRFMSSCSDFEDKLIYRATHFLAILLQSDE